MQPLIVALMLFGYVGGAYAADTGDTVAGKKLASNLCAQCHDTTGNEKPRSPPGGAPPFYMLAQSNELSAETMRRYLRLPHGRMSNLLVTGRDADDVVSYILTLRRQ